MTALDTIRSVNSTCQFPEDKMAHVRITARDGRTLQVMTYDGDKQYPWALLRLYPAIRSDCSWFGPPAPRQCQQFLIALAMAAPADRHSLLNVHTPRSYPL